MPRAIEEAEILEKNPHIDLERVRRFEGVMARMAAAGVDLTPQYQLISMAPRSPVVKSQRTQPCYVCDEPLKTAAQAVLNKSVIEMVAAVGRSVILASMGVVNALSMTATWLGG